MDVQLNQTEKTMLARLDPSIRGQVTAQLIAAKAENLKLREAQQQKWNVVRNTFGIKLGELGHGLISGLGIRFPVSLYPEQFEALVSNAETIRKFFAENAAEITKRKANRDVTLAARRKAKKLAGK